MGVSACGKTTIGQLLSNALNVPFYDADDFHPQANIEKMISGFPLNDDDRAPWLSILSNKLKQWNASEGAVLACSALKETYRQQLSKDVLSIRSEEHTSELQSRRNLVCRLLLETKNSTTLSPR